MNSDEKHQLTEQSGNPAPSGKEPGRVNTELSPLIQGFVALSLTTLLYCMLAALLGRWYHPEVSHIFLIARQILVSTDEVFPKPLDRTLYSTAVIFFPAMLFLLLPVVRRLIGRASEPALRRAGIICIVLACAGVLAIALGGLLAPNPFAAQPQNMHDEISPRNLEFYFINSFIYNHILIFALLIFPAILLYVLFKERIPAAFSTIVRRAEAAVAYGICGALTVAVFFMATFRFPYTVENKYDFNAVFYSVIQVFHGVPLLVDRFTNTYGLYPHFIAPLLKVFGLSILSFSGIMAFLLVVCLVCLIVFLRKMVRSPFLILLGFTTILYNCYLYSRLVMSFDAYFAMAPIRWILPFLLILFAAYYGHRRSIILYVASFIVFAAGILWCPDFGLLTFLSLIAFYSYLEFEKRSLVGVIVRTVMHGAVGVASVAVVFGLFSLWVRVAYGAFPDIGLLFSTMKTFSLLGSGLLPTPRPFHPWMLIALIYACGIAVSAYHIVNKSVSPRTALIFLLTAIGVTSFQYYMGRSHNWNLTSCSPWAFVLLTMFADDLLAASRRFRPLIVPAAIMLFALSFSLFQVFGHASNIADAMFETEARQQAQPEIDAIQVNANAIRNLTNENERVLILSAPFMQGYYHLLSHTVAAINPGLEDLAMKKDEDRIIRFLSENSSHQVFLDAATFTFPNQQIPIALASCCDARWIGGTILKMTPKQAGTAGPSLVATDPSTIVHIVLGNDPQGRTAAMQGKAGPIHLGSRFALQVLFRPADLPLMTMTKFQTVFSNEIPECGLTLAQQESRTDLYSLFVSGNTVDIPVTPGKWNYLAIEVDGTNLRVYKDGAILGVVAMKCGYRNSDSPFFVGDYRMQGGVFLGDIREIAISERLPDAAECAAAWKRIGESLGSPAAEASAAKRNLGTP